MRECPSPNFDPRPDGVIIDMLVLHYTGMEDAGRAIDRLRDPDSKVSAHYVIDEDGVVHSLVAEEMRAWHSGQAFWRGRDGVNGRSLGVELVNPGHEFGYREFPEAQMTALEELALGLVDRHPIEARNVLGHSDVAPRRKSDPGELFDWPRLAEKGIGLWPEAAEDFGGPEAAEDCRGDGGEAAAMLSEFGYETGDLHSAVSAFQRHFRPGRVDGIFDVDTAGRLKSLINGLNANLHK